MAKAERVNRAVQFPIGEVVKIPVLIGKTWVQSLAKTTFVIGWHLSRKDLKKRCCKTVVSHAPDGGGCGERAGRCGFLSFRGKLNGFVKKKSTTG
jgi:hypothetical protein